MSELAIRPRFQKYSEMSPEAVVKKLQEALELPHAKVKGTIIDQHIILRIPLSEQHYWSPQLDLEIEKTSNDWVQLRIRAGFIKLMQIG